MNSHQLKAAVAAQLEKRGVTVDLDEFRKTPMRDIVAQVLEITGVDRSPGQSMHAYLYRFADIKAPESARYLPVFRPMKTVPHPRAAEIDKSQPSFMSMAANPMRETRPWIEGKYTI